MITRRMVFGLCVLLIIVLQEDSIAAPGGKMNPERILPDNIWSTGNLIAWEAAPCDVAKRSSEQRAQMLERLGFKNYAYIASTVPWNLKVDTTVSQFDADSEIEAMQRHGIAILAWYLWINNDDPANDPLVKSTFALFRHHHIHPDLWIAHSFAYYPQNTKQWLRLLPEKYAKLAWPNVSGCQDGFPSLKASDAHAATEAYTRAITQIEAANYPKTVQARRDKIDSEAQRIGKLVKLASAYGCRVDIYNHHGWFGMVETELAILSRLEQIGITGVGIVYNFAHARDALHDDASHFAALWKSMQAHVVAINVTGLAGADEVVLPSKGDRELNMMRIIQHSGWKGPVGVIGALGAADTEENLIDNVAGIRSIAAQLAYAEPGNPPP
jgi:hypothetical protein